MNLYYTETGLANEAYQLVSNLPLSAQFLPATGAAPASTYLVLTEHGLLACSSNFKPLNCYDFYQQLIARRKANIHQELLIQAIKLPAKHNAELTVLDLTAGLGLDSIILSLAGLKVTMVEHNPYLAVILRYLCVHFQAELPLLTLKYSEHSQFLQTAGSYDYIYWDPMFGDGKKALAKKNIQLISELINCAATAESDNLLSANMVFQLAERCCLQKIIIKRDNKQPSLIDNPKPTYHKLGKTVRFDIYQC